MVLLDYSKTEAEIPLSIQKLVSKLILHLIELLGSTEDSDRAENHIRNQNTSKYLKFCQGLLSQECFIELDEGFEEFLFYFMRCSTMYTDDLVLYEMQEDIYAAAKDMEMDDLDRFLKDEIEEQDWLDLLDMLAYTITGDEINEYPCGSRMVYH